MDNQTKDSMKLIFGYKGVDNKTVLLVPGMTQEEVDGVVDQITSTDSDFILIQLDSKLDDTLVVNRNFLVFFMAMPCCEASEEAKKVRSYNNSEDQKFYRNRQKNSKPQVKKAF